MPADLVPDLRDGTPRNVTHLSTPKQHRNAGRPKSRQERTVVVVIRGNAAPITMFYYSKMGLQQAVERVSGTGKKDVLDQCRTMTSFPIPPIFIPWLRIQVRVGLAFVAFLH